MAIGAVEVIVYRMALICTECPELPGPEKLTSGNRGVAALFCLRPLSAHVSLDEVERILI